MGALSPTLLEVGREIQRPNLLLNEYAIEIYKFENFGSSANFFFFFF